jgi:hypothetical protein
VQSVKVDAMQESDTHLVAAVDGYVDLSGIHLPYASTAATAPSSGPACEWSDDGGTYHPASSTMYSNPYALRCSCTSVCVRVCMRACVRACARVRGQLERVGGTCSSVKRMVGWIAFDSCKAAGRNRWENHKDHMYQWHSCNPGFAFFM